jgi:hypothetical protein
MKRIFKLATVLFVCTILSACNKYLGDPTNDFNYDADAQKFMDSSGITDITQKLAVNVLVKQLKDSSLWAKMVAVYPMVGGTAIATGLNLKDPRNLDAAYRLTFYGSPVFAVTGVLFPTAGDYADTHLADSAIGGYNNSSISFYSRTQNTVPGYDMGCTDGAIPYNELSIIPTSPYNSEWFGFSQNMPTSITTGLFMLSSSATDVTRYRNGVIVSTKGAPPNNSYTNLTILIGKSRVSTHPGQKECAFATIGNGLTDADALTLYNIVQNFQTTLGR